MAANSYFLVKGLIRNKDIENKYKVDSYKIHFKKLMLYGVETRTTKREKSKIQALEIKFWEELWERQEGTNLGIQ